MSKILHRLIRLLSVPLAFVAFIPWALFTSIRWVFTGRHTFTSDTDAYENWLKS